MFPSFFWLVYGPCFISTYYYRLQDKLYQFAPGWGESSAHEMPETQHRFEILNREDIDRYAIQD